ncbi:hypothetical protein L829_0040 [Mycobacteroides abscessus MAB_030201_1075]|uniref:Uncharacterized protein n=1 Tax=Mycobacteroides abscessus MAB_030201_1075 TaxID=1335410 RepID=A0A829PE53_9MYCO|nr:hypothetical protein L829_0040 [Mycobacteroides abscessus MAB_030201_1075]
MIELFIDSLMALVWAPPPTAVLPPTEPEPPRASLMALV